PPLLPSFLLFFLPPPPTSPLFPYTTLFRSFLSFPVLVWLIDGCGTGPLGGLLAAAGIGWWFGFGYFLAGLYWIGNAFLVDAKLLDRKSTRLNSSHGSISYAVFCLKKKNIMT